MQQNNTTDSMMAPHGSTSQQDFRHILDQLDASRSLPPPPPSLSSSASSSTTTTSPRSVRATRLQPRPSPPGMRKLFGSPFHTFDSSLLSAATRDMVRIASVSGGGDGYDQASSSDTASLRSGSKTDTLANATPGGSSSSSIVKPQPKRSLSLVLPSPPRLRRSRSVQAKLAAISDDADRATSSALKDAKLKALEDELRLVKCHRRQERAMAHVEIEQLRKERSVAERQVEKFHSDLADGVAMEEYASLIHDMSPMTAVGPSHLSKLQAQLCKSLHNQGVLEAQMDLLKRECHTTVETIKDELATALQERDAMERELTQKLRLAEEDRRLQAKLFDERMASRVESISEFAGYYRMAAPLPYLPSMTTRRRTSTATATSEGRDAPAQTTSSAPCDVDTGSFVPTRTTADSKTIGIAHRLERERLQRERVEDGLRRKIDEKSTAVAELQAKVKSQQIHIGTLTQELDHKRRQDIRREMLRTHRRHASHSTVVTSAAAITRGGNGGGNASSTSSFSGIGGTRSGHSTPDSSTRSLLLLRSSSSSNASSTRPPLHKRGSSDPSRGSHLIGSSPTW